LHYFLTFSIFYVISIYSLHINKYISMLKSKNIIYPAVLMLFVLVPIARYYVSTPWNNDCMTEYVQNMEYANYKWHIYSIDWAYHIEPDNSNSKKSLEEHKIWEVNGCLMNSWNILNDLNNTVYCSITYAINKAPIYKKVKEPLALMDWEAITIFKL